LRQQREVQEVLHARLKLHLACPSARPVCRRLSLSLRRRSERVTNHNWLYFGVEQAEVGLQVCAHGDKESDPQQGMQLFLP
jgi:hypothetical protein